MKKSLLTIMILLAFTAITFADDGDKQKIEFSFTVGGALPQLDSTSSYTYGWRYLLATDVQERGIISAAAENSLFFNGSFSYLLKKNIGIQASFGYTKSDIVQDNSFAFNWTGKGRSFARNVALTGNGEIRVVPISLNGIVKVQLREGKIQTYFSGGYTFFSNKFNATSYMGAGSAFRYQGYGPCDPQCLDIFKIPVEIDQSWNSHGGNIGAGLDLKVTEKIAITADARYYYSPTREIDWNWLPGTYQGYLHGLDDLVIDAEVAKLLQEYITRFKVNPSFFQISAGIKFFFDLK